MGSCASLSDAARSGYAALHDGLMHAVAKVLECASLQYCRRNVVEYVLRPMIERQLKERKPYIRLGNLVVEAPGGDFDAGRSQLLQHMRELASAAPWLDAVYGVVTDGVRAEYYALGRGGDPELVMRSNLDKVAVAALANLCADKVPLADPEDIATVFGV